MAERLAAWEPDVCALQEVPTAAIADDRADHGHAARVDHDRPADRPARGCATPWRPGTRTSGARHEGNANVLLAGPRLTARGGQPPVGAPQPAARRSCAARRRLGLERGELVRYLPEPRRLVLVARLAAPGGAPGRRRLHALPQRPPPRGGGRRDRPGGVDAVRDGGRRRRGRARRRPQRPARRTRRSPRLRGQGWDGADPARGMGIDRILHRGLEVVEPARRLPPGGARRRRSPGAGRTRRVRLSDHDPVVAVLRVPTGTAS